MKALLAGFAGLIALGFFISAIPLSYRVEARSQPERFGGRRFGYTNIWAVALNIGVARDEETQRLRHKILFRLSIVAAIFVFMAALSYSISSST